MCKWSHKQNQFILLRVFFFMVEKGDTVSAEMKPQSRAGAATLSILLLLCFRVLSAKLRLKTCRFHSLFSSSLSLIPEDLSPAFFTLSKKQWIGELNIGYLFLLVDQLSLCWLSKRSVVVQACMGAFLFVCVTWRFFTQGSSHISTSFSLLVIRTFPLFWSWLVLTWAT